MFLQCGAKERNKHNTDLFFLSCSAKQQEEDLQFKQSLHNRKWTSKTTRTGMRAFRFRSEMGHITNRAEIVEDRNQIWADTLTECKDFRASKDRNISTFEVLPDLDSILTVGEKQFLRYGFYKYIA